MKPHQLLQSLESGAQPVISRVECMNADYVHLQSMQWTSRKKDLQKDDDISIKIGSREQQMAAKDRDTEASARFVIKDCYITA